MRVARRHEQPRFPVYHGLSVSTNVGGDDGLSRCHGLEHDQGQPLAQGGTGKYIEHLESSPAHGIQDLDTPILMAFGDEDGTVDFTQGVEFYNYARRAGKQLVLLVYPGENHGFRKKENQIEGYRAILEFMDKHLKPQPQA